MNGLFCGPGKCAETSNCSNCMLETRTTGLYITSISELQALWPLSWLFWGQFPLLNPCECVWSFCPRGARLTREPERLLMGMKTLRAGNAALEMSSSMFSKTSTFSSVSLTNFLVNGTESGPASHPSVPVLQNTFSDSSYTLQPSLTHMRVPTPYSGSRVTGSLQS